MNSQKQEIEFNESASVEFIVGPEFTGMRLDRFLVIKAKELDGDFSRSMFQDLIAQKMISVNGSFQKTSYKLKSNEIIKICLPSPEPSCLTPERIEFKTLFEDSSIIVISKPPGLVVHPACGNRTGTLVHGLLYKCHDLQGVNGEIRPGIVHRLDKDTSGVMVVAKNDLAHHSLIEQFKNKQVEKKYYAILNGRLIGEKGRIVSQIGRHPVNRKKMAVLKIGGKEAITNWQIVSRFNNDFYLAEINLETGRTHQIRVHMAHIGAPVAGDKVYGKQHNLNNSLGIVRQCLHAKELSFIHPLKKERVFFEAPIWQDMQETLSILNKSIC